MADRVKFGEDLDLSEVVALPDERQNVVRKNVQKKDVVYLPGNVAHYHKKEDEFETWEEPCHIVSFDLGEYIVSMNGDKLTGKVTVPQCQADYLAWQISVKKKYEEGIFRGKSVNRFLRNY